VAPPIGISCGDVSGIGPELIQLLWHNRRELTLPDFVVIGPATAFKGCAGLPLLEIDCPAGDIRYGTPNSVTARIARDALVRAVTMARAGEISAIVTAPVHKASLYDIGFSFPGQTEFLAHECGVDPEKVVMMMAGPQLRTVPLTVHIALWKLFTNLTTELIVNQAETVFRALQSDFAIKNPRLALAGLNPHAGEAGHLGTEEQTVMLPAIAHLQRRGITLAGPFSADGLFAAGSRDKYDAFLCPYHDQALIPVKTLDQDRTVNVTLGLPIIRTSPDHGTAHDIVGRGIAKPDSLIAALNMAGNIVRNRSLSRG
jgi:4-hydroxythreonine-4-phosphate dehydrogenase